MTQQRVSNACFDGNHQDCGLHAPNGNPCAWVGHAHEYLHQELVKAWWADHQGSTFCWCGSPMQPDGLSCCATGMHWRITLPLHQPEPPAPVEPPASETREFRIPLPTLDTLLARLTKLQRRANRNHLAPISWTLVRQEQEVVKNFDTGHDEVRRYQVLTVAGPAPRINGWTFVATLEHDSAGVTLVHAVPGTTSEGELKHYRTQAQWCDHCQKNRFRKDTFVLRSDAGAYKQVGRSCLQAFLNTTSPELLAEWALFLAEVQERSQDDYDALLGGFSGRSEWLPTHEFLAYVAQSMRAEGWVSGKQAQEQMRQSTRERAYDELCNASTCPSRVTGSRCGHLHTQPSAEDQARAGAAWEWARALGEQAASLSDFDYNLWAAAREETFHQRNAGIVAYTICAYERAQARELERTAQAARRASLHETSVHLGTLGAKITAHVTITQAFELEGDYGVTTKYIMHTDDGNVLTWRSSAGPLSQGDVVTITGRVQQHTEWTPRDRRTGEPQPEASVKQTQLTRCTFTRDATQVA